MPVAAKDPIGALIRAANLSGETNNWSGFEELMLQILGPDCLSNQHVPSPTNCSLF